MTGRERHIESLINHGAYLLGPEGNSVELNWGFIKNAINSCKRMRCEAVTYDLRLPEIEDPMLLAVWKDGHIDSGSVERVCDCLAMRAEGNANRT